MPAKTMRRRRQEQRPRLAARARCRTAASRRRRAAPSARRRPGSARAASRSARCRAAIGMARSRSSVPQSRSSSRPSETPSSMPSSRNVTLNPGTFWSKVLMVAAAAAHVALLDVERCPAPAAARGTSMVGSGKRGRLRQGRRRGKLDGRQLGLRRRRRARAGGPSGRRAARENRVAAGIRSAREPASSRSAAIQARSRVGAPGRFRDSRAPRRAAHRAHCGLIGPRRLVGGGSLQLAGDRLLRRTGRALLLTLRVLPCGGHPLARVADLGTQPLEVVRHTLAVAARIGARRLGRVEASASRSSSRRTRTFRRSRYLTASV